MENEPEVSKPKKVRIPYGKIGFEFLSVLFAVSLALTGNEWKQNRADNALVQRVINTMRDELQANKKEIERAYAYHSKLVDEIQKGIHLVARFPYATAKTANLSEFKKDLIAIAKQTGAVIDKNDDLEPIGNGSFRMIIFGRMVRIVAKNDSISIYGDGNIHLKSANVSNTSWEIAQATQALVHMDYDIVEPFSSVYQLQKSYLQTIEFALQILYTGDGHILSTLQDMVYFESELLKKYDDLLGKLPPEDD